MFQGWSVPLNKIPGSRLTTTQRGVRTQYDKLMDEFLKNEKEEMGASGTDAEYNELEQLLLDIYMKDHVKQQQLWQGSLKKKKRLQMMKDNRSLMLGPKQWKGKQTIQLKPQC